jgi:hypothetical protein
MPQSLISTRLANAHPSVLSAYCIVASFGTYFCMYAFRKPFTAGTFETVAIGDVGYKTVLIGSQVAGYALSKYLGIRFVSEMTASRRAAAILALIGVAEAALFFFAIVPPPYNFPLLFVNGLPLGMVFGLVIAFLEGRQVTEALAAGLCASFIVSSGVVKSVGRIVIVDWNVSEYWMPFTTGLLFIVPMAAFVWMLNQIPPPSETDVSHRSKRTPMDRQARQAFFARHTIGLIGLLATYALLTVMRSIRDDFAVEIWRDLGEENQPTIFSKSETLVMFGVVAINGAAISIRSNRSAFLTSLWFVAFGFALVLATLLGYSQGWLTAFPFMVLIGVGMYIPYVIFHTTLFERLIAVFRESGNIGYLIYLADTAGYASYILVMLAVSYSTADTNFLTLYLTSSLLIATVSIAVTMWLIRHYRMRLDCTPNRTF